MEARQCGSCGAVSMLLDTKDITENYKGEAITIKAMPGWPTADTALLVTLHSERPIPSFMSWADPE